MRIFLGFIFALALAGPTRSQSEFTGRIFDRVVCEADETQSYALYVPSSYTEEKKWPVIFCFDASARGRVPVERLQAAAEKYGYIVAGSLTSRNGPWTANAAAMQAMFKDVSVHFSLDPRRVYTAGVSGGARVATAVGLSGHAAGVIACAAGFPVLPEGIPRRVPFVLFGTTGTEDFNHAEMQRLDGELDECKAAHRIVIFNGGHEWASAELLTEAVEWLELQAMRAGTRSKDEAWVQTLWQSRQTAMPASAGVERWRALKSLVADFEGLEETSELAQKAKELGASREVKEGLKAERALADREENLFEELGEIAVENTSAKKKFAAKLRERSDAADDSPDRQMVRRAIANFFAMTHDTVRDAFDQGDYGKASALLEMGAALRPAQNRTWFDLARASAFSGDRKRALEALDQAAATGYGDAPKAEAEPAFAKLRGDPRFQEALNKIRENLPESAKSPTGR